MIKAWLIAQQCLCRGYFGGGVGVMIMYCGGDCQPVGPIVLLCRRQVSEVPFYPLVLPLRQSICLGVEGRRDILLDP